MPAGFASDAVQALESVDRLEGIEAAVIGFGQGDRWRGGVGATGRT